jgi:hypothetical protein
MIGKLTAALLLFSSQAATAQQACLPPAQAGGFAAALLPSMIESAARQCAQHLPEAAFLRSGSHALAERLRAETAQDRAAAAAAILAMTGQAAPADGQDPDRMIDVLTAGFASSLDPAQCRGASDLFEALAPLPTANFGKAFGAILGVMAAGSDEPSPICRQ